MSDVDLEQLRDLLRGELGPMRAELSELRRALDGDRGLRVQLARLDERVEALRRTVEDATPPETPDRRLPPDPPSSSGLSIRLPGGLLVRLLLGLASLAAGGGIGWGAATLTEAPPAVTAPAPPGPPGPQEYP